MTKVSTVNQILDGIKKETDIVASPLVKYIQQKGSIVGPPWKIPFMGPFLQSVNPKFHEYKAKWDSGELSCVSVFHK